MSAQDLDDFVVAHLIEVVVPEADRSKVRRLQETDDVIDFRAHLGGGPGCADGNGEDEPCGSGMPEVAECGACGGTGGQTVVDEDHGAVLDIGRGPVAPVEQGPAFQFRTFPGHVLDEAALAEAECLQGPLVEK